MKIDITVDVTNPNRREGFRIAPPYDCVLEYVYGDLQSPMSIREQLERVRSIAAGAAPPTETSGNAWAVMIGPVTTQLECHFNDERYEVATEVLIVILERWLEYMSAKVAAP